jgi:hypothetical protein
VHLFAAIAAMRMSSYDPLGAGARAPETLAGREHQAGHLCGELASKPIGALTLVALGYRSLSLPRRRSGHCLRCPSSTPKGARRSGRGSRARWGACPARKTEVLTRPTAGNSKHACCTKTDALMAPCRSNRAGGQPHRDFVKLSREL